MKTRAFQHDIVNEEFQDYSNYQFKNRKSKPKKSRSK